MRIPLAIGLASRDGATTKDAKVKNALIEPQGQDVPPKLRKRPGCSDTGLIRAGIAQWLGYWNDQVVTVQADYLNLPSFGITMATWNPSDKNAAVTLTNGNLSATNSVGNRSVRATVGKSSGKWYWEITSAVGVNPQYIFGAGKATATLADHPGGDANGWGLSALAFASGGGKFTGGGGGVAYSPCTDTQFSINEVIGVALDMDAGTITIYRGGVSQGVMFSGLSGTIYPMVSSAGATDTVTANFGASAFTYSVPPGFHAGLWSTAGASIVVQSTYLNPSTASLQFSGQDNGANAPKKYLMVKNAQQAWVADSGGNVTLVTDVDYPGTYAVTLTSLTRSGTTATATTATDTNFQVGSAVVIAGATPATYNGSQTITSITPSVSRVLDPVSILISRSGTTATATSFGTPHGIVNGQSVTIAGADQAEYNGTFTITWISGTQFSYTVTVTNSITSPATVSGTPTIVLITAGDTVSISISAGTATVTWPAHGLETGAGVAGSVGNQPNRSVAPLAWLSRS
jgi:hypothetical protein